MGGSDDRSSRKRRETSKWRGFRVEPDEPSHRLFLFATDEEMRQVDQLMIQIGERSAPGERRVRFVNTRTENFTEVLGRVESAWRGMRANPLHILLPGHRQNGSVPTSSSESMPSENESVRLETRKTLARTISTRFDDESHPSGSPVTIGQGSNGELVLRSEDFAALDQLESLFRDLVPDANPYKVYQLLHESPSVMQQTIEEILSAGSMELTTPLRFVSNTNSKSLMVFGASPSELKRIDAIIASYDQPLQIAPEQERKPQFFHLKYAKAESVVTVIKDVYRDLLSPDDEVRRKQESGRSEKRNAVQAPTPESSTFVNDGRPKYKGILSVGKFVDTNTVVVSSPQYLTREISEIVKGLDRPEAGTVFRIMKLDGSVSTSSITAQLQTLFTSDVPDRSSINRTYQATGSLSGSIQRDRD